MTHAPELFWTVPSSGDSRFLGDQQGVRRHDFGYLSEVARTADTLGFDGVLIPTRWTGLESLTLASALAPLTRRVKLLAEIRPGLITPTAAARFVSTLDDVSGGRTQVNVITPGELKGDGLFVTANARYDLADEWLTVFRSLLEGQLVDFEGRYVKVKGGRNLFRPVQEPHPPIYFGGSSVRAIRLAGKHADVYLSWGEPHEQLREKLAAVQESADREGRTIRLSARFDVVVRRNPEEAWRAAEERIGLPRAGSGTALVGSPEQVAKAIQEYRSLGVETFILSGSPHIEEAFYVAELLFPVLGKESPVFTSTSGQAAVGD